MNLNKRNIFLFDAVGAILSLLLTGMILPLISEWIGIAKELLYFLALFPLCYAFFSMSCFRFAVEIKRWMLMTIMIANIFYCLMVIYILLNHQEVTILGRSILFAEIIVVLIVVAIEMRVYRGFQDT